MTVFGAYFSMSVFSLSIMCCVHVLRQAVSACIRDRTQDPAGIVVVYSIVAAASIYYFHYKSNYQQRWSQPWVW